MKESVFMDITSIIALPLGYVMEFCQKLVSDYGLAIILFTLLTKIIILPLSVWVQKNSIKMVEIQPQINRIKARYYGNADTIAEEQTKLFKEKKYNPLASLFPLIVQIVLLMGVVGVIYNPFNHLFRFDGEIITAINDVALRLSGLEVADSSIQLTAIEYIKNPKYYGEFLALSEQFPNADIPAILTEIKEFDLEFLGFNLSWNPSVMLGITIIVPIIAGLSSWIMCVAQNAANVLQAEQTTFNKYFMLILSVGLSLYLGFFVPAGIALYWVASNLLAIVQLYALNAVIPPKKYVDYEELEASRKELAELDALGGKKKMFSKDPNAKREKADYKKFFKIGNMHIVFYSERSGFYKYYEDIIDRLLKKTNLTIHYVTNDPDDVIFKIAEEQPRIKPYYIGVKKLITLMMRVEADIVVMTTPELDNGYIKRSLMRKDIEYIFVPHDSASFHMGFKEHSLDNFDTVFCTGPHIANEVRASEKVYGTKEKKLVEFGYPLIDKLIDSYDKMDKEQKQRKQILIGPSWQEDNLLDSCVEKLIDELYCDEYHIIVRPHPEYMKRFKPKMDALVEKYKDKVGEGLTFELDFSTNVSTYASDLLITDWSGIGLEFCFATLKPALFINTKMKMENPNYEKIGLVPQEVALRNRIGVALDKNELDKTAETVKMLIESKTFREDIKAIRESHFYGLGTYGAKGADYIARSLVEKSKNKNER